MATSETFRKKLSLNDTGQTGAHMAGILIPKTELAFFPRLSTEEKNPRAEIKAVDPEGRSWDLNYIYYNNASFGGTRNEYRLTGLTGFINSNHLRAGDSIILTKGKEGAFFIATEKETAEAIVESGDLVQDLFANQDQTPSAISGTSHGFRPAARIVHTIGASLIKDSAAAVMELVKNSYDADASEVQIEFSKTSKDDESSIKITVSDNGHGMSRDTIVNTWMVPATNDKVLRKTSPKGRILQGNKGIGRFAAFLLGDELFVRTIHDSIETSLLLQSSDFRTCEFLDEVRVLVETRKTKAVQGSSFEMLSSQGSEIYRNWARDDFDKLRTDLRRMLFPFRARAEEFKIVVSYVGFTESGMPDGYEEIEALPVFDFFDYRIEAEIDDIGQVTGTFFSPLISGAIAEPIAFKIDSLTGKPCGRIFTDIRVVDREAGALQNVLDRSATEGEVWDINRSELKKLLDEACGISVFRGDFRIRPYGDPGDDWLELDRRRINNPTLNVSNNQTFGLVRIQEEIESHLEETSARDGLREDDHYLRFRQVVSFIVIELQRRRFDIRRQIGRVKTSSKVEQMLTELKESDATVTRVVSFLEDAGVPVDKVTKVREILRQDQAAKDSIYAELQQTIAMYQGQATLGKMIGVLLHEGNRDLGIIRDSLRRLPTWSVSFSESPTPETATQIVNETRAVETASSGLVELFEKFKPLGVRSRGPRKEVPLHKVIDTVVNAAVQGKQVTVINEVPPDFQISAWRQDLHTIFLNLLDNSLTWFELGKTKSPTITFRLLADDEGERLEILDNGPGIPEKHIQNGDIFEPHFSLREGSGIGLPIAGEAATRNGFTLRAWHAAVGTRFTLDFSPIK